MDALLKLIWGSSRFPTAALIGLLGLGIIGGAAPGMFLGAANDWSLIWVVAGGLHLVVAAAVAFGGWIGALIAVPFVVAGLGFAIIYGSTAIIPLMRPGGFRPLDSVYWLLLLAGYTLATVGAARAAERSVERAAGRP